MVPHAKLSLVSGLMQAFAPETGKALWSTTLTDQYEFVAPPVAAQGIVGTQGAGDGSTIYALSQSNGAIAWTQNLDAGTSGTVALSVDDGAKLAMDGSGSLRANVRGDATISNCGTGDIDAAINDGSASLGITGSGTIRWRGNAHISTQVNGSGEIQQG